MKITKTQLRKIIKEELAAVLNEDPLAAMNAVSQDEIAKSVAKTIQPKLKDQDLPSELQMFAGKSPEEITNMLKKEMNEAEEQPITDVKQGVAALVALNPFIFANIGGGVIGLAVQAALAAAGGSILPTVLAGAVIAGVAGWGVQVFKKADRDMQQSAAKDGKEYDRWKID